MAKKKTVTRRSVTCECMILRRQKAGAHRSRPREVARGGQPKHKKPLTDGAW